MMCRENGSQVLGTEQDPSQIMLGGKTEEAEPRIELEKINTWVVVIRPVG